MQCAAVYSASCRCCYVLHVFTCIPFSARVLVRIVKCMNACACACACAWFVPHKALPTGKRSRKDTDPVVTSARAGLVALFAPLFPDAHEVDRMLEVYPTLASLPADELRTRIGQASFLLHALQTAQCALAEIRLIKASLLDQPMYFAQPFAICFENDQFVVVDKPFDIQISHGKKQKARFPEEVTLVERTAAARALSSASLGHTDLPANLRRCHNLDFATSGMLALAKTDQALRLLSSCFNPTEDKVGTVQKEYVAVILGHPDWDTLTFTGDIDADPASSFKMRVVRSGDNATAETEAAPQGATPNSDQGVVDTQDATPNPGQGVGDKAQNPGQGVVDPAIAARWGPSRMPPAPNWDRDARSSKPRVAVTDMTVLRRGKNTLEGPLHGRAVSLVKLSPNTGRRHQLRVHLAYLGFPILGDVSYVCPQLAARPNTQPRFDFSLIITDVHTSLIITDVLILHPCRVHPARLSLPTSPFLSHITFRQPSLRKKLLSTCNLG